MGREPKIQEQGSGARGSPGIGARDPRSPVTKVKNPGSPATEDRGPRSPRTGDKDPGSTGTGDRSPGMFELFYLLNKIKLDMLVVISLMY
jgi:hypothetical protein